MSRRGYVVRGRANKRIFRSGYNKVLRRSIIGLPMARAGGRL